MSSKNHIFSEGPNGFSGWRPFTENLIFSRRLITSLFIMSNSDNSNSNNKSNSNKLIQEYEKEYDEEEEEEDCVEEITLEQFMQLYPGEEEKIVDLSHIKYRPYKRLPTKLSYKQIQEFREKGLDTPKEQLNWLNAKLLWNSLDQDQKCLLAAHLLGDELFAKGDKQALHLYTDDNEQKDGPMSIQFLCWWDDLEKKLADFKKPKIAQKHQKKFEY